MEKDHHITNDVESNTKNEKQTDNSIQNLYYCKDCDSDPFT